MTTAVGWWNVVAVTASWFVGSFVVFFGRNTMSLRRCDGFVRRWFFDRRMTFGGSTVKGVTAAQFQNNGSLIFVVGGSHTFTGILSLSRIYLVRMGDHSIETIPIQSMRQMKMGFYGICIYIYISMGTFVSVEWFTLLHVCQQRNFSFQIWAKQPFSKCHQ